MAFDGWKYVGPGFHPGVPARDIDTDEARELGIGRFLNSVPEYERVGDTPKTEDKPRAADKKD